MERKTVLVTGCAGYIGSVLTANLLSRDYHVIGMDILMYDNMKAISSFLVKDNFEFRNIDVRDSRKVFNSGGDRADFIIPLAALVGAPLCDKSPKEAMQVNFEAVRDLAKRVSRDQKIVYPNTNSGYGKGDLVDESSPLNPLSLYGRTKCDAEKAVLERTRSTVFRLATVFGASPRQRMDLLVNDFTEKIYRATSTKPFIIFEGHFKRNLVHVEDVARAFVHAIETDLRGVYNCGHPDGNITKWELAEKICLIVAPGKSGLITHGSGTDPDQRSYGVSNEKLSSTGFVFTHSLEQGIKEVFQLCRNRPQSELAKMRNFP